MSIRLLSAALAIAAAATPASAAIKVTDQNEANACYENAALNPKYRVSTAECNIALRKKNLSNHDLAATYVNRGIIRLSASDNDGAIRDFEEAIRIMPTMGDAHINRAAVLVALNREEEAIVAASKGLEVGAEKMHIGHYVRATAYELNGEIAHAFSDYKKASELSPKWDRPRKDLARFKLNDRAAAENP